MKRRGAARQRKSSEDEELARVMAELESEHAEKPAPPSQGRRFRQGWEESGSAVETSAILSSDSGARRLNDASGRGRGRRDGVSNSDETHIRRALSERPPAPEGYEFDATSGFYYNPTSGYYYEFTPTRELYCHSSSGVWCYMDVVAKEWRAFPPELLSAKEAALVGSVNAYRQAYINARALDQSSALAPPESAANSTDRATTCAAYPTSSIEQPEHREAPEVSVPAAVPPTVPAAAMLALPEASRRVAVSVRFSGGGRGLKRKAGALPPRPVSSVSAVGQHRVEAEGEEQEGEPDFFAVVEEKQRNAMDIDVERDTNVQRGGATDEPGGAAGAPVGVVAMASTTAAAPEAVKAALQAMLDWDQFICGLCQRKFSSSETLQRHISFSRLHQDNLARLTG